MRRRSRAEQREWAAFITDLIVPSAIINGPFNSARCEEEEEEGEARNYWWRTNQVVRLGNVRNCFIFKWPTEMRCCGEDTLLLLAAWLANLPRPLIDN